MNLLIIAVIGFLGLTIWGRVVQERGLKMLTNEQRGTLLERLSATRKWSVIFLAGIILGFLILAYYVEIDRIVAMYAYFAAFIIYSVAVSAMGIATLRKMDLPEAYIKTAWLASILRLVGLIVLMAFMGQYISQNAASLQQTV
jgi:hypothetical protein